MSGDGFRDIVQRIKDEVDLVELVGSAVPLKRAGGSFKGSCPFHQEKTPSFHVVPAKRIFYCFGCGAKGSAIDWVMRTENLEFREAVEKLARQVGLELPEASPADRAQRDARDAKRRDILAANEKALRWFQTNLAKNRNPLATAYLPERGLKAEMIDAFDIGASIDAWDGLKNYLLSIGFSEELLVEAGLCKRSESGRVYDTFRNRLMFPILDVNGRPVAFGGRQLVKEEMSAKYMNSPETELYKKKQHLYALNIAKEAMVKSGYAILCEGYMDVIMAHAHGHREAVASLGTALGASQARLLKRFASRVYFLYDGDTAGRNAMLECGTPLLAAGFDTRVILLPEADDPDTFLRREGSEALRSRMEAAPEFFDWALDVHSAAVNLATLAGQAELAERMASVVNALKNDVMREGAILRLLHRLGGLPREALTRILQRRRREDERRESQPVFGPAPAEKGPDEEYAPSHGALPHERLDRLEKNLLKLMIESNEALELARSAVRHEWITDRRLEGWIFHLLDSTGYAARLLDEAELAENLPGDRGVLYSILAWELPEIASPEMAMREMILRLHERHQQAHTRDILGLLENPALSDEERQRILTVYHREHRTRLQDSSRHLRTRDSAARRRRFGKAPPPPPPPSSPPPPPQGNG